MIKRREFLTGGAVALAGISTVSKFAGKTSAAVKHSFKLKYAPHASGLVRYIKNMPDRLDECASYGFKAFEYNGLAGDTHKQAEELKKRMDKLGMEMGVFTANPNGWKKTGLVNPEQRSAFLDELKRSMTYVDITQNKFVTIITGSGYEKATRGEQIANLIDTLRYASDIAERHNVTLCVEPLNVLVDHPGYFLSYSDEAYQILKGVNRQNIKMLFDIYHQQIMEGNLINNIRKFQDEISTFHVGDNPGRHEPGSGEINYRNVFKAIYEIGHKGFLGLEFSASSDNGKPEGFKKVVQSIVDADNFL